LCEREAKFNQVEIPSHPYHPKMRPFHFTINALLALFVCHFLVADGNIVNDRVVNSKVSRTIDLSTQLAKISCSVTLQNDGDAAINHIIYTVDAVLSDKLAFISFTGKVEDDDEVALRKSEIKLDDKPDVLAFHVELGQRVEPGDSVTVSVESTFSHALTPFPKQIGQSEKQFVIFSANHHYFSPYKTTTQSTSVNVPTSSIESYTKEKPVSVSESSISYGPYTDTEAYSVNPMRVHFENNSPFISVADLVRVIEVSHWGNIAVEEHYHIKHRGAELKGSFSRYDYQRSPAHSSVKSFKTILPAAAADVYYRDEIGNISTSHMLAQDDSVELEIRPRFPLFGGWQTRYYIGYNVPSYEYLFNSGSNFLLKMRFVDHVFDDFVIDNIKCKVILPEGSDNVKLVTPYGVKQEKTQLHHTYLDTFGRPVVVASKQNLVDQHIQDFELHYTFNKVLMLQEPLLVFVALYLLFILVIIYVRMDFSISKDEASESRMRAAGLIEEVQCLLDRRSGLYNVYGDAITKFKSTKDASTFANARKKLDGDYRALGNNIHTIQASLNKEQHEAADKLCELGRKETECKHLLDQAITLAEKVVNGRMKKETYVENESANRQKREKLREEIDIISSTL